MEGDTVTLSDGDWESGRIYFQTSSTSSLSRSARIATVDAPEITQEISDSGIVLVYFKTIEGFGAEPSTWTQLPYSILAFGSEFTYHITSSHDPGELKLYYYYTPNGSDNTAPSVDDAEIPDYVFKYIAASEDVAASVEAEGVSLGDHDEVVGFLTDRFDAGEDFRVLRSH